MELLVGFFEKGLRKQLRLFFQNYFEQMIESSDEWFTKNFDFMDEIIDDVGMPLTFFY